MFKNTKEISDCNTGPTLSHFLSDCKTAILTLTSLITNLEESKGEFINWEIDNTLAYVKIYQHMPRQFQCTWLEVLDLDDVLTWIIFSYDWTCICK